MARGRAALTVLRALGGSQPGLPNRRDEVDLLTVANRLAVGDLESNGAICLCDLPTSVAVCNWEGCSHPCGMNFWVPIERMSAPIGLVGYLMSSFTQRVSVPIHLSLATAAKQSVATQFQLRLLVNLIASV